MSVSVSLWDSECARDATVKYGCTGPQEGPRTNQARRPLAHCGSRGPGGRTAWTGGMMRRHL